MKKKINSLLLLAIIGIYSSFSTFSQTSTPKDSTALEKLTIGGYGQIDFNQHFIKDQRNNATLDIHRMVLLFGYQYNSKLSFLTEIEMEHVSEVYVEQAYLNYSFSSLLNFRAGLVLIPMGIINEYHEPSTFNGVERPMLDTRIVPTTWREIGAGFTGTLFQANLSYQLYLVNGFASYNGAALLNGTDALRKGRQKGAESFMSQPNLSTKINFFGISGLEIGLSGYFGKTQSTLYKGILPNDNLAMAKADSSVVNIKMFALDYRFSKHQFRSRAQVTYSLIENTLEYNHFTGKDLGSALLGYYGEVSYVIPITVQNQPHEFEPFVRYEHFNTHFDVHEGITPNKANAYNGLGLGIGYRFHPNAIVKADYISYKKLSDTDISGVFSMGVGISF